MREIMGFVAFIVLSLVALAVVVVMIRNGKGTLNSSTHHELLASLDSEVANFDNPALTVNIQDPNFGGLYTVQRAHAEEEVADAIQFEDDVNHYFQLKGGVQDQLTLETQGSAVGAVPPAILGTDGKAFDKNKLLLKGILQGHKGVAKIVPDNDEVQKQMLLGLCSVKGTSLEKELVDSNKLLGLDKKKALKAIFDGSKLDKDSDVYKGCIGLQMISPRLIEKALGDKAKKLKDSVVYVVCDVKSREAMEKELKDAGVKVDGDANKQKVDELIDGLTHLQEGEVVIIPQRAKAIVKDTDKVGVFTSAGKMARH